VEYDIWATKLVFAFLEGYYEIYVNYFYNPIINLL